ncbi:hypothetical protein BE11_05285 [Sorangium cellulosum]|nr:hypothetical protein BE11_05285 [Sorangium cellulosum]
MTPPRYPSPERFKQALEARIRSAAAAASVDVARYRQQRIFDRFLARIAAQLGDRAVLKGGVAMTLWLPRARTTRDIDLGLRGHLDDLLVELRIAGQRDLGDFLAFDITPDPRHPTMEGEGIVYEGSRFRAPARLAGKVYGDPFGVDIAVGDRMLVPPETRTGDDFFAFAALPPTTLRVYAREVHVAEKLHAFTLPRSRENSRVKDLPDLALLAATGPFQSALLRDAIHATFTHRGSHVVPAALPAPPASWARPYADMAQENDLSWSTLEEVFTRARDFLDPLLRGEEGIWDPTGWSWRRG